MDFKYIITLAITVGGWCVSLGMYFNRVRQLEKEIEEIKHRQNNTDKLLTDISKQLTELNTKVSLLIDQKIKLNGSE
ncbi:MAG: hypothetical protein MJ174_07370 [Treponema sp.]|nr:hypothetical protein [Treponema sp.]